MTGTGHCQLASTDCTVPSGPTTTTNWPPWLEVTADAVSHRAVFATLDEEQIDGRLWEFGLDLAEHLVGVEIERRAVECGSGGRRALGRRELAIEVHPRLGDLAVVERDDQVDKARGGVDLEELLRRTELCLESSDRVVDLVDQWQRPWRHRGRCRRIESRTMILHRCMP